MSRSNSTLLQALFFASAAILFSPKLMAVGGLTPGGAMPQISNEPEPFVYPTYGKTEDEGSDVGDMTVDDEVDETTYDIDDSNAPRMLLKGFELYGIKEYPEQDIGLKQIQTLIADETDNMIRKGQPRLFTIDMFEQVANAITRYYRNKGFILARAYIPQQKVKDGIVKLQVVESTLETISFDGNKLYDDETMQVLFEDQLNKPVFFDDINDALYKLNDYPGLSATAVFGPGSKPGAASVVMRTVETPSYNMVSLDNYGTVLTGENRLLYRHRSNNLLGNADLISFNAMTSVFPSNNQYFDVVYSQPVFKSLFKVGGGVVANTFKVGEELEDLGISGQSFILNGFIDYKMLHSDLDKFTLLADLSLKNASSDISGTTAAEDKLSVIRLDARYSGIDRWLSRASQDAFISVSVGLADFLGSMDSNGDDLSGRVGGSGGRAGGDFTKINFGYSRLQPTFGLQSLLFRFHMQQSSDLLTSLEQYSMGGPYDVRAYPVASFLADNATFASFEYIFSASTDIKQTWLNRLQLSIFFDYATGTINDPIINEKDTATLSGLGIGIQALPFEKFTVRMDLATATGDEPADVQSLPFYLSMQYRF